MTAAPAKRNASTARRSRRDRHHYLAGYLAGVEAGLKEAVGLAGEHNKSGDEWVPGSLWDRLHREFTARIRARIAEIERSPHYPPTLPET